jgi:thioredoxin reductase (NADPH)
VLDCRAYGGQAGASARIENYLGFPTGISGQALAGRAFVQAQKFGAEILIPTQATSLDCALAASQGEVVVALRDGRHLRARTLVIASGARYRRPALPGSTSSRAAACGSGRPRWRRRCARGRKWRWSAAATRPARPPYSSRRMSQRVHILVRGDGLAATMSRYLIDRIDATENIDVHPHTELVALRGDATSGLQSIAWRDARAGVEEERDIHNVFLFIGAEPETEWLAGCGIELDARGFVLTRPGAASLETSVPGVFAVGDVRSGSVKRVGSAIGEGAAVVAQIHQHLAARATA